MSEQRTWAAVLRDIADRAEREACKTDVAEFFIVQRKAEAAQLRQLAPLLERVPERVHVLERWSLDKPVDVNSICALRDILRALAAGPQGEVASEAD